VSGGSLQSDAWQLIAARVQELARLCAGRQTLRHGALSLGPREAIAYVEMSRGLLVHWVRLRSGSDSAVADYRVLAPTEWNFHPEGALARAIREHRPDDEALRLLLQAFDPCVRAVIAPRGSAQCT
jgi:Ni,Fe-hydrogenase I large subunit